MFRTLILKEIHESVLNFRFWLVSILCLLLIPFGLFISSKDYKSRIEENQREEMNYLEKTKGNVRNDLKAEGYFRLSPLSILSAGFRDYLPHKAVTSSEGYVKLEKKQQNSNLQSVLFGKIDFVFIVTNFLSLLALIFTFGSISSEKEMGTIKLVLSNPVQRWKVILAKICGNYIVFLAPFIISLIIGLLVIQLSIGVNLLSSQYLPSLIIILIFTMLILFLFFNMGILASVISKSTITSIVVLLFIWIFFSLGIPRISPMIAQIIYPVKTEDVFNKEYVMLRNQIQNDYDGERRQLLEKLVKNNDIEIKHDKGFPDLKDIAENKTNYAEMVIPIDKKYEQRFTTELNELEKAYFQIRDQQITIASNLARISPVSSYSFLATELSNTGLLELNNCRESARKFQYQVTQDIYSHYIQKRFIFKGLISSGTEAKDGKWPKNLEIPKMTQYSLMPIDVIFQKTLPDMVLLFWYSIIFFASAFVSFLRYDVR